MNEPVILDHATLYHDDCLSVLKILPENSVDSVICDPPAGIAFMNKRFDSDRGGRDLWIDWLATIFKEVYRVMKPGAHGLVWALPRTSYWTAMALDNAGFNIRDRINYVFDSSELAKAFFESLNDAQREVLERLMESQDACRLQHYFGSGFPKSLSISRAFDAIAGAEREIINKTKSGGYKRIMTHNAEQGYRPADYYDEGNKFRSNIPITELAKQWNGYFSALKPAVEDYWLIRKPLEGSIAENVMKWECGGLNIDKCRVGTENTTTHGKRNGTGNSLSLSKYTSPDHFQGDTRSGRYPAHLILDGSEAVCSRFRESKSAYPNRQDLANSYYGTEVSMDNRVNSFAGNKAGLSYSDSGSSSRFFKSCPIDPFIYHSKASTADRNEGCEELEARFAPTMNDGIGGKEHNQESATPKRNSHPTVKSTSLFSYFATLLTKPGGLILDPFIGSGTTGVAAVKLGYRFIGCEMESEYFAIAQARIKAAQKQPSLFHEAESFFPSVT